MIGENLRCDILFSCGFSERFLGEGRGKPAQNYGDLGFRNGFIFCDKIPSHVTIF